MEPPVLRSGRLSSAARVSAAPAPVITAVSHQRKLQSVPSQRSSECSSQCSSRSPVSASAAPVSAMAFAPAALVGAHSVASQCMSFLAKRGCCLLSSLCPPPFSCQVAASEGLRRAFTFYKCNIESEGVKELVKVRRRSAACAIQPPGLHGRHV